MTNVEFALERHMQLEVDKVVNAVKVRREEEVRHGEDREESFGITR